MPFGMQRRDRSPTGGCTTNLPIEDLTGGKAWVVFAYGDEPLKPEHGGPARLLVPHLYFWKSAKWVRRFELRADDEPGFLGVERVSPLRRSSAGTAVLRRVSPNCSPPRARPRLGLSLPYTPPAAPHSRASRS